MSKRRINIQIIGDDVSDEAAVRLVREIIGTGRISTLRDKPCYCFHAQWPGDFHVEATLTRSGADSFKVYRRPA